MVIDYRAVYFAFCFIFVGYILGLMLLVAAIRPKRSRRSECFLKLSYWPKRRLTPPIHLLRYNNLARLADTTSSSSDLYIVIRLT